jgi:23S rRNA pseudouridine2605 synthase
MAERIRIQKAIAKAGLMSRRAAEEAMIGGRVMLNEQPVVLGDRVDPSRDVLTLDGVPIPLSEELETHLLNKPAGVISTASDPHGRKTVVDLVPTARRLYPVGRLDADSEGLILLSNDGELTNRVTHPRFGVTKTYLAEVEGKASPAMTRLLVAGIELEDGLAKAASAHTVDAQAGKSLIELVMVEGRNREVRRMMEAVGYPVTRLVRTAIGGLSDARLRPGESRRLSASDIRLILAGK